jgi:hypothetical protein
MQNDNKLFEDLSKVATAGIYQLHILISLQRF